MNAPRTRSGRSPVKLRLVHLDSGKVTESGSANHWLLITLLVCSFVLVGAFVMRFM